MIFGNVIPLCRGGFLASQVMVRKSIMVVGKLFSTESQTEMKTKKPFTIVVEGNIGSGKTTFLENFIDLKEEVLVMSEPVNKWRNLHGFNLLDLMYKDPCRHSYLFQTYVQLTMLQQHVKSSEKPIKMMERSLARYCFVENLYACNRMSDVEYVTLSEWFNFLVTCPQFDFHTDLIIYLQTEPERAYERILKRSRNEENRIPFEYIKSLHELHEDWLVRRKKFQPLSAPVVVIDANEDLTVMGKKYSNHKSEILSMAKKFLESA